VDYSFAEQLLLEISGVALEGYRLAVTRPRAFWGVWAVACAVAAILLLRPGESRPTELNEG
jgi:hypothetical protein